MKTTELLNQLAENGAGRKNGACKDNIIMLGDSLLRSFGISTQKNVMEPNLNEGYKRAEIFLKKVCAKFKDPTHIVRIAPFAYVYLGAEMFEKTLNTVLERAANQNEQNFLDEIFTATALLNPKLRNDFLSAVSEAKVISGEAFGLDYIISAIDPKLNFTSAAEFPKELNTNDVKKAADLIGAFLELGLFSPGEGFNASYQTLKKRMNGFDYLLKNPKEDFVLAVGDRELDLLAHIGNQSLEITPEFNARPDNNGENPSVVILNKAVQPEEVQKFYRNSTILYLAQDKARKKSLEAVLKNNDNNLLLVDTSGFEYLEDKISLLSEHLKFIRKSRKENDVAGFDEMINIELEKARSLIIEGNEHFYDIRDVLDSLGRRKIVDDLVAEGGYKLPVRTDYSIVMLLSKNKRELEPFFLHATRKNVKHYSEMPQIEETGMPFVIITNLEQKKSELLKKYPSATIIYLAGDDAQERKIQKANPANDIFVINAEQVQRAAGKRDQNYIGRILDESYFDRIASSRGKGVTDMLAITKEISSEIKKLRDKILFAGSLADFYDTSREYYKLQEKFRATPSVLQMTDPVLMKACPTGGCFNLKQPEKGGCCGGGNVPDILIDFAIAYRKQVGEKRFLDELKAFHGGKVKEPWYIGAGRYERNFKGIKETADNELVF